MYLTHEAKLWGKGHRRAYYERGLLIAESGKWATISRGYGR
jgi:hypothetical protein